MSYRSHPTFCQLAGFRARREAPIVGESPWKFNFDARQPVPEPRAVIVGCAAQTDPERFMRGLLDALGAHLRRAGAAA